MEEAWEVIWFKEAWYPERLMTYPRPHSSWGKQQSQREAEWQSRDPRMHLTLDTYHTCFWPWAKDVMFWRPSFFICEAVGTWHMVDSLRISVPFPPSYWDFLASLESNGGQDLSLRDLFTECIKIRKDGRERVTRRKQQVCLEVSTAQHWEHPLNS